MAARHKLSRIEDRLDEAPLEFALDWEAANKAFHKALIEASGSPRLIAFHDRLYDQSSRFRLAALREGRTDFPASRAAHDEILQAVLRRDREAALAALTSHITGGLGRG